MAGAAFGREIGGHYRTFSDTLWPSHTKCSTTRETDFSYYHQQEKHTIYGTSAQKREAKTFEMSEPPKVYFIPLEILTELPNLNGLIIKGSDNKFKTSQTKF
jgi:hypothetical protein